jgi:DNA-directed RNA polymerase sigma subunit (sigma70/sigma32)
VSKNDFLTDYLQSLYGIPVLDSKDEYALADRIAQGDDAALETLVKHNLRFVVYTIRKLPSWHHSKTPQEDIIGMANEGLLKAAMQWQPTNNAKFATYAKGFILRAVERGLDNTDNLVRIPIKVREEIRKMTYTERALTQTLGKEPTIQELATILNKPVKRINQLKFYLLQEPSSLDAMNLDKLENEDDLD